MAFRTLTGAVAAAAALAAHVAPAEAGAADFDRQLDAIVRGEIDGAPLAGAAIAVRVGGEIVYAGAAGCAAFKPAPSKDCARPLTPTTTLRVASISKMALALGLDTLREAGKLDLDRDVSDYLGWRLRNPDFPDRAITARQLLSHTSSIRDPEEYWIDAPGRFEPLFRGPDAFAARDPAVDKGPGAWFEYANINYGVLAALIEAVSGQRFDRFMTASLLKPLGLDAGYNWSGASARARREGAALHRFEDGAWRVSVDDDAMRATLPGYFRAADDLDRAAYLKAYRPGDNPSLFSPQGGLRASVVDLTLLASELRDHISLTTPVWRHDSASPNGETDEGYFGAFGLGVQTVIGDAPDLPLDGAVGHPGEAYGLYSGAWLLKADPSKGRRDDVAIAFAVTGAEREPAKGPHPTFLGVEAALMKIGLEAAAPEPRPFDEKADAATDVDAAMATARREGKNVILVLGANWCHDSRGLAKKFNHPRLAPIIEKSFVVAYVDVGRRDRNLEIAKRFGVAALVGTPTVLILDADGTLLNRDSVHDWTTAYSRPLDEAIAYFSGFAPAAR